jgi:hypothetical protein
MGEHDFIGAESADSDFQSRERWVMKKLGLCLMVGMLCLTMMSIAGAQQEAGKVKASSSDLSGAVCQAIEQYISKVDSARSLKAKTEREEKYAEAQNGLAEVLQRHDKSALLSQVTAYATYTELVAHTDPTNPQFDKIVDQRLKSRAALLDMCTSYTLSR